MNHDEKPPNGLENQIPPILDDAEPAFSESLSYSEGRNVANEIMDEPPLAELIAPAMATESIVAAEIVEAISSSAHHLSQTMIGHGQIGESRGSAIPLAYADVPPDPEEMDNVAAIGGAVAAVVLGAWSIIGSLITTWSIINCILGIPLGIWGLTSPRRRWATVGIALCVIGFLLSTLQINEMIQALLRAREAEDGF
jgi:hypothetical protein